MADSSDDIDEKAKKFGWSPSEVAYYKSLRGDIPQALPSQAPAASPNSSPTQTQSGQLNPQNIDPSLAQGVQSGFQGATGMWAGGTAGGPTSMSEGGEVEKPHDKKNLDELRAAFDKFIREEAVQKMAGGGEVEGGRSDYSDSGRMVKLKEPYHTDYTKDYKGTLHPERLWAPKGDSPYPESTDEDDTIYPLPKDIPSTGYARGGKVHTPAQVPGLEPAQQQIEMKQNALHRLKEHDRHRVRQPSPKKPK